MRSFLAIVSNYDKVKNVFYNNSTYDKGIYVVSSN